MNSEFIRPDGRKPDQMRNLEIEVGVLDRADGSAKVVLGNNMAIASVFGPREMHPKHASRPDRSVVRINYRMSTFSVNDYKKSFPSRREKEISKVLSEAFESVVLTKMFPRSVIDAHVQIFESDGGTRTAAAIAISAALADAGIPMRDLTGAIASGLYEDTVCLDLNGLEDNKGSGDMPLLYSPNIDEISLFQLDGLFTFEQFKQAYTYSLDSIKLITDKIQQALKQKYVLVRDQLAIEEEEEEVETQYSGEEEAEAATPPVGIIDEEEKVQETTPEVIPEPPVVVETSVEESTETPESTSETAFPIDENKVKSITDMISEESDVEISEDDADMPEFDRSTLKPMGGILSKIESDEESKSQDDESGDENLEGLYKKIKEKDEDSSNDIMRDIEYSDLEEDN